MAVVYSNRRRLLSRVLCAALLAVVVLAGAAAPKLLAQSDNPERILSYDVAIQVHPDSSMNVTETIRVHAAGDEIRHGILREFPTEYRDRRGDRIEVGFHVEQVTRDGKPERYSVESLSNGKRVRIGSRDVVLDKGEYTYAITYRTDHQLGFFEDHDELYWNATGFWGFEIDKVTVRVSLPDGVPAGDIRTEAYTGPSGAQGRAYTASVVEGVPTFETTEKLGTYEGITIVVGWPKGFVTPPPPIERRLPRSLSWEDIRDGDWWRIKVLRDAGGIALATCALILLVLLAGAWVLFGRDPAGRSIAVAYEPPADLSPAETRYLRTLSVDPKAMTAAVLDLAAKKYLTIEKDGSTYVLKRTGKNASPPPSVDEAEIARALFSEDSDTATQRATFDKQMADLKKQHPTLAKITEGLMSLVGPPDDANTVRLRRSSPRLLHAFNLAKEEIERHHPQKKLMRTNAWPIVLAVMFAILATILCAVRYPGRLADDGGDFILISFFFMLFNAFCVLVLGGRIVKLLPAESFAPHRTLGARIRTVIGLLFAAAFTVASGWLVALMTSLEWAVAYGFMWLTIALFARLLKQPTELGQKYFDQIEGFRQFLAEVDEDRLNRMNPPNKTPELFEAMLPYALALDCELQWAKKFESVLATAATAQSGGPTYTPSWYVGQGDMLNASAFTNAFSSSFSSAIASSTTPPGSSSGFSGGGGGGSSGGGGGGGGGGGW